MQRAIFYLYLFGWCHAYCDMTIIQSPAQQCGTLFPFFQLYLTGNEVFEGDSVAMGVGEVASLSLLTRYPNSFFRAFFIRTNGNIGEGLVSLEGRMVPRNARRCNDTIVGIRNSEQLSPRTLVTMRFQAKTAGLVVVEVGVQNANIAVTEQDCFHGQIQLQIIAPRTMSPTDAPVFLEPTSIFNPSFNITPPPTTDTPTATITDGPTATNVPTTTIPKELENPPQSPIATTSMQSSSHTNRCLIALLTSTSIVLLFLAH